MVVAVVQLGFEIAANFALGVSPEPKIQSGCVSRQKSRFEI